jgi:hypothetical protein
MQRRLSEATVNDLVGDYLAGSSIDSLAAQLRVNRTTIIQQLDRRGIDTETWFS